MKESPRKLQRTSGRHSTSIPPDTDQPFILYGLGQIWEMQRMAEGQWRELLDTPVFPGS